MWPFGKSSEVNPSRQSKWDTMQHTRDKAETDFFKAIKANNLKEMEDILGTYPDLLVCLSPKGRSVLHYAIAENSLESFKFLLEKNASTFVTYDYAGWDDDWSYKIDVLSAVCYRKKKDFVFAYLERCGLNTSPNSSARSRGEESSEIKSYLANAAQIRADYLADQKLKSELALEKKVEEKLEDKQASIKTIKKDFFAAIKSENVATLEKTIKEHPEAFEWQEEKTGLECLFYAMEVKKPESFRALIHLGADINKKRNIPDDGAYPIHFATAHNLEPFLLILLQRGAEVSKKCGWSTGSLSYPCTLQAYSHGNCT